ncbi:MAG: malto-oligosyltrehalose synthase, partial [Actinomycetota bacterium]
MASPGVPDFYQGSELWDLSLVDPDNRRDVDHDQRRSLLEELRAPLPPARLLERADEGLPKLWLIRQSLTLRSERPAAFGPTATYRALWPSGSRAEHVIAFLRGDEVATVAPLQVARLGERFPSWDWQDTRVRLPEGRWTDRLSGRSLAGGPVELDTLLASFPVALLVRER